MRYSFKTNMTCSRQIDFSLAEDCTVSDVIFYGGCDGNLKAIPLLIEGWQAQDVIDKVAGLTCRTKPTSCTDQLARALQAAQAGELAPIPEEK